MSDARRTLIDDRASWWSDWIIVANEAAVGTRRTILNHKLCDRLGVAALVGGLVSHCSAWSCMSAVVRCLSRDRHSHCRAAGERGTRSRCRRSVARNDDIRLPRRDADLFAIGHRDGLGLSRASSAPRSLDHLNRASRRALRSCDRVGEGSSGACARATGDCRHAPRGRRCVAAAQDRR